MIKTEKTRPKKQRMEPISRVPKHGPHKGGYEWRLGGENYRPSGTK